MSRRPGGCAVNSADIYFTRLHPALGWLEPEHLGCEVNSSGDEFPPSYVNAGGGALYFSSNRDGLHRRAAAGRLVRPAQRGAELNTLGFNSFRPNVSADGRPIVFDSDRPGGLGATDIWSATRASVVHAWSQPVKLGPNINSAAGESRPSLSGNGQRLYFGSGKAGGQGSSDIYVSEQ